MAVPNAKHEILTVDHGGELPLVSFWGQTTVKILSREWLSASISIAMFQLEI